LLRIPLNKKRAFSKKSLQNSKKRTTFYYILQHKNSLQKKNIGKAQEEANLYAAKKAAGKLFPFTKVYPFC